MSALAWDDFPSFDGTQPNDGRPGQARPAVQGTCSQTGKTMFTQAEAKRRARNTRRKQGERVGEYHCSGCGGWHYGHSGPKLQGRKVRR